MFENSVKRLFYQDKTSTRSSDPNAYSAYRVKLARAVVT
jgi:hypothetical protein